MTIFKSTLTNITDRHASIATKRVRVKTLPWLTADIRDQIKRRDYHHNKALKMKTPEQWSTYRALNNKRTSLITETKRGYYSSLIDENKGDSSKLWKPLKFSAISANTKCSNIGSLETTTGVAHEPRKIEQGLAHYLGAMVAKVRRGFMGSTWRPNLSPKTRYVFKLSAFSEEFVMKELKNITSSKSTGLADISARLVKDGSVAIARPLTVLMNRSLAEGSTPLE